MVLRKGAQGEVDVMVGDPVCADPAVRPIPGGDAIEAGQDEGGSKGAIGGPEGPNGGAIVDHRTESRLVGVAPDRDRGAAVTGEVAPFSYVDAGAFRVCGDDVDV